jgi:hypothetical protein
MVGSWVRAISALLRIVQLGAADLDRPFGMLVPHHRDRLSPQKARVPSRTERSKHRHVSQAGASVALPILRPSSAG